MKKFDWPSEFREENVDGRTDGRRSQLTLVKTRRHRTKPPERVPVKNK